MLQRQALTPEQIADARKEPLAAEAAWELLSAATEIQVAKGKKVLVFDPRKDDREAILAHALGPTGNLRAPALRIGDRYFIGFSESLYDQLAE